MVGQAPLRGSSQHRDTRVFCSLVRSYMYRLNCDANFPEINSVFNCLPYRQLSWSLSASGVTRHISLCLLYLQPKLWHGVAWSVRGVVYHSAPKSPDKEQRRRFDHSTTDLRRIYATMLAQSLLIQWSSADHVDCSQGRRPESLLQAQDLRSR